MKTTPISLSSNPHVVHTRPRQTALPASRRFASELKHNVAEGVGSLLRVGGTIMGAALPRPSSSTTRGGEGSTAGSFLGVGDAGTAAGSSAMDQSMELLALQQQIQMENQRYTTLSNVLKARHETNKNAISNLR